MRDLPFRAPARGRALNLITGLIIIPHESGLANRSTCRSGGDSPISDSLSFSLLP